MNRPLSDHPLKDGVDADGFYALHCQGTANHTTATDADADVGYRVLEGDFPDDLTGYGFYTSWDRASAEQAEADGGTVSGASFLSSPGRVFRLELGTGDRDRPVRARLRTLQTAAARLRALSPELFARSSVAEASAYGISNLANVAPLPFGPSGSEGHRMLLGCDPAIPTELDPSTLTIRGPVGRRKEWTPFLEGTLLPMTMTSGHPFYDPNDGPRGTLYIPDLKVRPPLLPWRRMGAIARLRTWDGSGEVEGPFPITLEGQPLFLEEASIHQVGTTRHHVLLAQTNISLAVTSLLFPAFWEQLERAPLSPKTRKRLHDWRIWLESRSAQLPYTRLFILNKRDIEEARAGRASSIPCRESRWPWETSHFLCDYETPDDILTIFAQLSIGFDATRSIQEGEALLNGRRVPHEVSTIFGAATDLQVAARYRVHADRGGAPLDSVLTPGRDPDDPRFSLGVMTQIATTPLPYRPLGSCDVDLAELSRRWSHTFWCSTGWMPSMESEAVFSVYRKQRVDAPTRRGQVPIRYIDEETFLDRSRRPENTAVLYRLDRDMELELDKDVWRWPAGWLAATPFFAPRAGATTMEDGYLVTLVSPPHPEAGMEIWVFDAARPLAAGPVCRLTACRDEPLRIGYPLHSCWMDPASVDGWSPPRYQAPLIEMTPSVRALHYLMLGTSFIRSFIRSRLP